MLLIGLMHRFATNAFVGRIAGFCILTRICVHPSSPACIPQNCAAPRLATSSEFAEMKRNLTLNRVLEYRNRFDRYKDLEIDQYLLYIDLKFENAIDLSLCRSYMVPYERHGAVR